MSNVRLVQDAYEAFGRADIPGVLAMMDPDIEWREAEGNPYQLSGEAWKGPDAILENLFMKMGADYEGTFVIHPKIFHDAGDTVVVEGRYTGTFKPTGKDLDAQYCHVFKLRDGKLTSFQQFVDTAHMQEVMGTTR
jgi:ketosteroid isomerase-like protein